MKKYILFCFIVIGFVTVLCLTTKEGLDTYSPYDSNDATLIASKNAGNIEFLNQQVSTMSQQIASVTQQVNGLQQQINGLMDAQQNYAKSMQQINN